MNQPELNRDEIITHEEIELLISSLVLEAQYHPFAIYGLMFIFGSIKKSLEAGYRSDIENICLSALLKLYSLSDNGYEAIERVTKNIHVSYRAVDFKTKNQRDISNVFVKSECIEAAEKPDADILDLSGSQSADLALKLSELLKDERLPAPVYNAIMHGIDEINNSLSTTVLQKIEETPAYIRETFSVYEKQTNPRREQSEADGND